MTQTAPPSDSSKRRRYFPIVAASILILTAVASYWQVSTRPPNLPIIRVSRAGVSADVDGGVTLLINASPPPPGVANDCS